MIIKKNNKIMVDEKVKKQFIDEFEKIKKNDEEKMKENNKKLKVIFSFVNPAITFLMMTADKIGKFMAATMALYLVSMLMSQAHATMTFLFAAEVLIFSLFIVILASAGILYLIKWTVYRKRLQEKNFLERKINIRSKTIENMKTL